MNGTFTLASKPVGYKQITVSTAGVGLSAPTNAKRAVIYVEAQPIRWRDDAVAPTSSVGVLIAAAASFELQSSQSINGFKAIRSGGTDATLNVVFYGV